jgi:hypothetical protein
MEVGTIVGLGIFAQVVIAIVVWVLAKRGSREQVAKLT